MDTLTRKGEKSPFLLPPKSKNQIAKSTIKRLSETTQSTIKRKPARISERIPVDISQSNMI